MEGMAAGAGGGGAAGGAGGFMAILPQLLQGAQTAKSVYDFASPQGPVAQGDFGGMLSGIQGISGGLNKTFNSPNPAPSVMSNTSLNNQHSSFDLNAFNGLPQDVQLEVLRSLSKKGGSF